MNLFYWLYAKVAGRKNLEYMEVIEKLQQMDRKEILNHQLSSLNLLIESAVKNSQFYKNFLT